MSVLNFCLSKMLSPFTPWVTCGELNSCIAVIPATINFYYAKSPKMGVCMSYSLKLIYGNLEK